MFETGDQVECYWEDHQGNGWWWDAQILKRNSKSYRVSFDGYDASWNMTVRKRYVRSRKSVQTNSSLPIVHDPQASILTEDDPSCDDESEAESSDEHVHPSIPESSCDSSDDSDVAEMSGKFILYTCMFIIQAHIIFILNLTNANL